MIIPVIFFSKPDLNRITLKFNRYCVSIKEGFVHNNLTQFQRTECHVMRFAMMTTLTVLQLTIKRTCAIVRLAMN